MGRLAELGPLACMSDTTNQPTPQPANDSWKVYEAHTKMAWDVTNFYARGITFFLAINAAVFGYVLKVDIEKGMKTMILVFGFVTGILFLLCSVAFVVWTLGIWRTVQDCFLSGDSEAIQKYSVAQNFARGRKLFGFFMFGALTLIVLIIIAYALLIFR